MVQGMNMYMYMYIHFAFHFNIKNVTFMDYISMLDPVVENVVVCIH